MQKELTLFKELFQPFENIAILHINHDTAFLDNVLQEVATQYNGKVKTIAFENEADAKLKGVAREYEYIVLSDIFTHCPQSDKIMALMYKALENSGNIIILEPKENANEDAIIELLDKTSFVAINNIDDLFKQYNCITAKKLHMWGSSL
jgi:intein/homing endonuclease